MDKVKLVIPEEGLVDLPKFDSLKLNLSSRKPKKKGRNTYKLTLSRFRRTLKW